MIVLADPRALLIRDEASNVGRYLRENSVDAWVTDPPAGIAFMGKGWDKDHGGRDGWIAKHAAIFAEALRVMKPGAHGLVWALPRTSHWTATALENAGFEIRDIHLHLFGTGFPKSLDVSKAIDAHGGESGRERALRFTSWMRSTGVSTSQINAATESSMGSHYLTDKRQPEIAVASMFDKLRSLLPPVPEEIESLVAERTAEHLARRPVVGERTTGISTGRGTTSVIQDNPDNRAVTAAHTPEAAAWEGWGTALKPAAEHWILVRKPLAGTVAANVLEHGTGALNIDACRIGTEARVNPPAGNGQAGTFSLGGGWSENAASTTAIGRWPAHVSLAHLPECDASIDSTDDAYACVPGCPVRMLDEQSAPKMHSAGKARTAAEGSHGGGTGVVGFDAIGGPAMRFGDSGGASRFFYVAKPSRSERDRGCEALPPRTAGEATDREEGSEGLNNPRAGAGRTGGARNFHPTVKAQALMRWLIRLITPPGGLVLDTFCGSGSTGVAALAEGCEFVGIDRDLDDNTGEVLGYCEVAKARLEHALKGAK